MASPKDETNSNDHHESENNNNKWAMALKSTNRLKQHSSKFTDSVIDVLPQRFEMMKSSRTLCEISLTDDSEDSDEENPTVPDEDWKNEHEDPNILLVLNQTLTSFENDMEEPSRRKGIEKILHPLPNPQFC
mmetsp:Transcript_19498/g.29330  ORF Transcript_19498/g.29330 Transcript_19498/m.29330 type:complete len:132 (+) Transcript_19498:16-411(+)